jgi:hypothetical protein
VVVRAVQVPFQDFLEVQAEELQVKHHRLVQDQVIRELRDLHNKDIQAVVELVLAHQDLVAVVVVQVVQAVMEQLVLPEVTEV